MNAFFERKYVIQGIITATAIILLGKLFYMQVIDEQYILAADDNVLRTQYFYPERGIIEDRHGNIIVQNEPVYEVTVIPRNVKPFDTLSFCKLLHITKEDFDKKLEKARNYSPYRESPFEKQIPDTVYASLQEHLHRFPGFFVQPKTVRNYPHPIAAHILGYISEVNPTDIEQSDGFYRPGDMIGRSGIERAYEEVIRGQRGVRYVMADAFNRPQGSFQDGKFDTAAVAGEKLVSSLDLELQIFGEQLMQNKIGSIVAIEPETGEVLTFVSSPTYDPGLLVGRQRGNNYMQLLNNEYKPFFIRPIQAQYPPGSIFKPIMALIGQQEGIVTPESRFPCYGGYRMGSRIVRCTHVHTPLNLPQSIQHSCNAWYCHAFAALLNRNPNTSSVEESYNRWKNYLENFGLGVETEIELPYESSGILKPATYYDNLYGKNRWRANTIISLAIGQGELGLTPLQMANATAVIANKGYHYRPHLIKAIGEEAYILPEFKEKIHSGIDEQYFDVVHDGMQAVMDAGTGYASRINGISICGKTGTAQNPHGKDHATFVAFAPREDPKIVIAVVVENAGFGGTWAAPIASLMIEKYLRDTISRPESFMQRILKADLMPPSKEEREKRAIAARGQGTPAPARVRERATTLPSSRPLTSLGPVADSAASRLQLRLPVDKRERQ